MRLIVSIALLASIVSCGPSSDSPESGGGPGTEPEARAATADGAEAGAADPAVVKSWGKGISPGEFTPVSAILASPDDYVGKTVRVEGPAVAVCQHRGCWFNIGSDAEGETLRFKVADGEMVFPPEIVGETMRAEGVFTANELDLETTKMVCENKAKADGEEFDPNTVTECMTVYQITGTGAIQLAKAQTESE